MGFLLIAFKATSLELQENHNLVAYGMIVLLLAHKQSGISWLLYNKKFQQHRLDGAPMPWTDINPSLLATTVLGHSGEGSSSSCPLCLVADHSKDERTLESSEQAKFVTALELSLTYSL